MTAINVLEIDKMTGIGDARYRVAEAEGAPVPAGTVVVSADSHWLEGDIWIDRFPEHLKDRAPRMFFENGGWEIEVDGKRLSVAPGQSERACAFECVPGFNDVEARMRDLDAEGVDKEILFPQRIFALMRLEDHEQREWVFRAYNQHLAEVQAQRPDRLYGVGILKWWDPEGARDALAEIKDLGLKTFMVPLSPGNHEDGEPIIYNSERMDPFWDAVEEAGLPVCFHIGENTKTSAKERGIAGTFVMEQMAGMRHIWSHLTFGGVFQRNPTLKVIFVESGLHWVPGALQQADMIYESFPTHVERLEHAPSYYWYKNCYATFMVDPAGLEQIDRIGAGHAMWSSDYPHNESTFGYTRSAIKSVFDSVSEEDAKKIVGGNAVEVFGLD